MTRVDNPTAAIIGALHQCIDEHDSTGLLIRKDIFRAEVIEDVK